MFRERARFRLIFVLGLAIAVFSNSNEISMRIGTPFILLGVFLRIWANGCVKKTEELCTWGPYAHTRNPLYLGTILIAAGFCIISRNIILSVLFFVSFFIVYRQKILGEEKDLLRIFGKNFEAYIKNVPSMLPRLSPYRSGTSGAFNFKRFSENKEIRNTLWIFLLLIVFYLKQEFISQKSKLTEGSIIIISLAAIIVLIQLGFEIKKSKGKKRVASHI